jgi:DNA-directed RNA polymerase subunit RPC12/RpoP
MINRDRPSDEPRKSASVDYGTEGRERRRAGAAAKMAAAMVQGVRHVTPVVAVDPYAYRWRELRRRQVRVVCVGAVCLTVSILGVWLLPSNITRLGLIMVAGAITVPFVFALNSYPCPRCKKPFFERSDEERLNYLAKKCAHCGLMIGTSKVDAIAALDEPEIRIIG